MTDSECVTLLVWALPQRGWRWRGFRNVRGQVCKRLARRIAALGLRSAAEYRARLESDSAEWKVLDRLCGVTISRFYRDRIVWDALRDEVLPALAQAAVDAGEDTLRCWSIVCASGEEPYTLSITWGLAVAQRFPGLRIHILATDFGEDVLRRAGEARYASATLRDLPEAWRGEAFETDGDLFRVRDAFRAPVQLEQADIRADLPDRTFRLVLCRCATPALDARAGDFSQIVASLRGTSSRRVDGKAGFAFLAVSRHRSHASTALSLSSEATRASLEAPCRPCSPSHCGGMRNHLRHRAVDARPYAAGAI